VHCRATHLASRAVTRAVVSLPKTDTCRGLTRAHSFVHGPLATPGRLGFTTRSSLLTLIPLVLKDQNVDEVDVDEDHDEVNLVDLVNEVKQLIRDAGYA
jgi:hypothetical protein